MEEAGEGQISPEKAIRGWRRTEEARKNGRILEKNGGCRRRTEEGRKSLRRPKKDRGERVTYETGGHWSRP